MEKNEKMRQQDIGRFKAQAIETSLDIVESVKNGETQMKQKDELETLHMEKILEYLPEDVDILYLEEEKAIYREKGLGDEEKPLIWGEYEIKRYIKKLKKGKIWK